MWMIFKALTWITSWYDLPTRLGRQLTRQATSTTSLAFLAVVSLHSWTSLTTPTIHQEIIMYRYTNYLSTMVNEEQARQCQMGGMKRDLKWGNLKKINYNIMWSWWRKREISQFSSLPTIILKGGFRGSCSKIVRHCRSEGEMIDDNFLTFCFDKEMHQNVDRAKHYPNFIKRNNICPVTNQQQARMPITNWN